MVVTTSKMEEYIGTYLGNTYPGKRKRAIPESQARGVEDRVFWTTPFPRNYTKFCYTPWPFQGLKPRPWKYRTNFSWSLLEIPRCFKLTAGKSTCYFFNTPGNSIFSTPLLVFFWDGPILFEIEKKLKTKKLLNITILDEQESATEPKKCMSEAEICISYSPKPGNWPLQYLYLKINSGFHGRKSSSEATISESSQIRELHEKNNF